VAEKVVHLNPYQQAAVDFREGVAVVQAAPGSGKTQVVIARVQALIREGVHPRDLLSLTFTNTAAKEMRDRAELKCEEKVFSTFHSWALAFIKREAFNLPFKVKTDWHGNPSPLCLPPEAARTLAQLCAKSGERMRWKDVGNFISLMKRRGVSPAQAWGAIEHDGEERFISIYAKYEQALREKGVMDFDSIVIETANLLKNNPEVRARNQIIYCQVDEAQDTDSVQVEIIKQIISKHGNCIFVGDCNQGMFSWRGAVGNLEEHVLSVFPNAKVLPLAVNYRSTQEIINYCKEIAPHQNESVRMVTTPNEQGVQPTFRLYGREDEEARAIVGSCMDLGNTAVLTRTNRQLLPFEIICTEKNLRYKLLGKSGYWAQHEVKDTLAIIGSVVFPTDANILRMLVARCTATKWLRKSDSRDHKSITTALKDFQAVQHEKTCLSQLLLRYQNDGAETVRNIAFMLKELRAETSRLNGGDGVRRILDSFGVLAAYDEADEEVAIDNDPRENIQTLITYANKKKSAREFYEWALKVQHSLRARTGCISLGTIHSAKGKEWPRVFVAGVNRDVLPHINGDLQEEKQIFFVACSRAALSLNISASGVPSDFIKTKLQESGNRVNIDPWEGWELLRA
jgi:DNA helicase-2/ATP-dependent DNA helicase PcrA